MKLTIKTKDIELEYQDEYSMIEDKTKDRIKDLLKTIYEYNALSYPATIINPPFVGTVEEFFNDKKK